MADDKGAGAFRFVLFTLVFHTYFALSDLDVAYIAINSAGKFSISKTSTSNWVAKAEFSNKVNETGWSYLSVTTNGDFTDEQQSYAAGVVEGFLTKDHIKMHWKNTVEGQFCERPLTPQCYQLRNFLQDNLDWIKQKIQSENTAYWTLSDKRTAWILMRLRGCADSSGSILVPNMESTFSSGAAQLHVLVKLFLVQVVGLTDGYFNRPNAISTDVDPFGLYILSLSGDMEDIPNAMNPYKKMKPVGSGSCSALIKLLPGNSDLYVSHDTWDTYQSMLRMLKKYDFAFKPQGDPVAGRVITMSSYPGVLLSGDDYYLISSGLASQETTIGNSNPALYKYVTKDTVLEGIRTMVANRIARTGDEWASTFSLYNSGTYNNQWMVVDYSRFTPGFAPGKGLLTILEQIPGTVQYEDKTDLLKQQTYWPSYNIAYFPEIFNKSGCWDNVKKYGDWFTYDKAPRAQIFKRDHSKVKDLESMQKLMRYNDFKHDPLARCNCTPPYSGENGISARCDLNPANGTYPFETLGHRSHGGTDMKLTNYAMFKNLEFIAISGPTYDQLPPFQWSKADFAKDCPHFGHPDIYKFEPVHFNGTFTEQGTVSVHVSLQ